MQRGSDHKYVRATLLILLLAAITSAVKGAYANDDRPLRVAVISDLNGSYGSTGYHAAVDAAIARIISLDSDLVISAGDMVAGQRRPHLSEKQVEAMWLGFHRHVSEPLAEAGIPLAVTPGNHDASAYRGFERERQIYARQWGDRRPDVAFVDDEAYPWHYAFSVGGNLFISLDVTTVGNVGAEQKRWLGRLLEEHGADFQLRIAFSHVPLWPTAQGRESEFSGDLDLERILREGNVDIYINGHQHAFYPGFNNGITFVGLSCLGSAPRRLIGTSKTASRSFAILEIAPDRVGLVAVEAPGFDRAVPWHSLPARIEAPEATLQRADTAQDLLREIRDFNTEPGSS